MIKLLVPIYFLLIFGLPVTLTGLPFIILGDSWTKVVFLFFSPFIFSMLYVLTAGLLSLPHQKAIIKGKFPRKMDHPIYGKRRLYGLCWTSVYYFSPIYWLFLSVPVLKKMLFRLFGYKGCMDFTVYPDTWIRDLPILNFGKGAYISNRATIGTNIILNNGFILVDGITIEEGGLIGHLTMLAPGVYIGKNSEIGVGSAIGIKTKIQDGVLIGPTSTIEHGVNVGSNTKIEICTYVGTRSIISENLKIPPGSNIPPKSIIKTEEDISYYVSSKTKLRGDLLNHRIGYQEK